jgi:hypothetical protein
LVKKLKKVLSTALSIFLMLSVVIQTSIVYAEEGKMGSEYYLSDLKWTSASHGDYDTTKEVQKDHPFTPGNNGEDTKISLAMEDGATRTFEKGLGTVAASPSSIVYNITGAEVTSFSCYLGIDRTANHSLEKHAMVEKVEITADDEILYSSIDDYPNGINWDTTAIPINISVPKGAEKFELKSYAGETTWGDEIVFADAKFTATGTFPDPDKWNTYTYLSDLNWISATHGDADTSKKVQKNHPFTAGNNGQDTQISLLMKDGMVRAFEKGIGTVAAYPSVISYDISGAGVSKFKAFVGIDRTGTPLDSNYAHVDKIEVVVDEEVIYSSEKDYPDGISYETEGIYLDLDISENASTFQLKSYAGEYTWADEVVYADAKFMARGTFVDPDAWQPAEKRREISNTSPLMMIPLYANGETYSQSEKEYGFWGDDTLSGKWEEVPDDLKPYTVIELHPDDLPKRDGAVQDFYEHFLKEAQNHVDPETKESDPIPIVLTVYTAGNQSYYTAAHWITNDWIEEMYRNYSCLQGLFCTENYWVWASGIESRCADYLTISAKYGGYFIWSEQNNGAAIEKAMGTQGQTAFKDAVEKYSDYFIFMYKNTPAGEGNDAPTSSYMTGLWLADYVYQWGGLMDTWKWYETGKWKLFETGNIGKSQGNRQWLTEPEALVGIEAMMIYTNGGCVYNFEHPAYTYGVQNEQSPLYKNVIQEFFRYVIENPAPSKEEMLASTKAIVRGNLSSMGNGNFFVGLNTEMAQSPTYTTGRYGNIPFVPSSISLSKLEEVFAGKDIEIVEQGDSRISTLSNRQDFFNSLYAEEYQGDIFAKKVDNTWYVANYKYNENVNQTAENMEMIIDDKKVKASAILEPHSYVVLQEKDNVVSVKVNNYRTNKDELWEDATTTSEAASLPEMTKKEALSWVFSNYIHNTQDQERRETTITLSGWNHNPEIKNIEGVDGNYSNPSVTYDEKTGTVQITVISNGYVYFDIV